MTDRVVVSKMTPSRGRKKLHTCDCAVSAGGLWIINTPLSRLQVAEFGRSDSWRRQPPRRKLAGRLCDYSNVELDAGVFVPATTLVVILDAMRSGERPEIDLDDIKTVVSQLGSAISRLGELDAHSRRLAERALYTEILRRCTTV